MNIKRAARLYWKKVRENSNPSTNYIRKEVAKAGFLRLILPQDYGGDPLKEWKALGDRTTKRYKHRLPGNWNTKRGIKKRRRAILSVTSF